MQISALFCDRRTRLRPQSFLILQSHLGVEKCTFLKVQEFARIFLHFSDEPTSQSSAWIQIFKSSYQKSYANVVYTLLTHLA